MQQSFPLEVHDLTVAYHKRPVLYGVDVEIPSGQLVGIMGPNGAGKSTFIKAVMGVVKPASGWIKIFGEQGLKNISQVGYVPQRESVDWDFPVSVYDVALMGRYGRLGLGRRPTPKDHQAVKEALDRVQMTPFMHRQIGSLSGGQQQRVFLARALAQETMLYLMDEPFAGVDAATEKAIVDLLHALKKEGKTIIVVHHDLTTAKQYFDLLMLLNLRLVAFGPVEQMMTPTLLQKTYGGRLNILSQVTEVVGQNEPSSD